MIAHVTNSPLSEVWSMSVGQVMRYANCITAILPLINPMASPGTSEKAIDVTKTSPQVVRAILEAHGVRQRDAADR